MKMSLGNLAVDECLRARGFRAEAARAMRLFGRLERRVGELLSRSVQQSDPLDIERNRSEWQAIAAFLSSEPRRGSGDALAPAGRS